MVNFLQRVDSRYANKKCKTETNEKRKTGGGWLEQRAGVTETESQLKA